MKKSLLCPVLLLLFISIQLQVNAQTIPPSQWNTWINDPAKNVLVKDTFRVQSFESGALDTWGYTLSGNGAALSDVAAFGPNWTHGTQSMRLPSGSAITFDSLNVSGYVNMYIKVYHTGKDLVAGQNLSCSYIKNNVLTNKDLKDVAYTAPYDSSVISSTNGVTFSVSPVSASSGGYYVDNVFIFGSIPAYSLFSGTGNWSDSTKWSNLPPARKRSALLAGNVTVQNSQQLKGLTIGNGLLTISEGAQLTIDSTFTVYHNAQTRSGFVNKGDVIIKDKIQLITTLAEKGKWYFISFPFDVYTKGIDPRFVLKDNQSTQSGNFIYAQQYDGQQRAASGSNANNWKPLASSLGVGEQLVFQKDKGYLIALDGAASDTTLTFTSQAGTAGLDFARQARISVPHYNYNGNASSEHSGWYLCGNPFPAPMSLNKIQPNTTLGNFVYWYNGSTYQVFDAGSTQSIPAYGAFFFKTTAQGELSVSSSDSSEPKAEYSGDYLSSICITLQNETCQDRTELRFRSDATAGIDVAFDAYKLTSLRTDVPQIGSYTSSGKLLAINSQSLSADELHVPLFIQTPVSGDYSLSFQTASFVDSDYAVFLSDKQTKQVFSVTENNTYSFSASADQSDRFELILQKTLPTGVTQISGSSLQIQGNSIALTNMPQKGLATVMLLTGQRIWQQQVPSGSSRISMSLNRGTYILQLRAGSFLDQQLFIIAQ